MNLIISKATVMCSTSSHHGKQKDILVQNGIITQIASKINPPKNCKIITAPQLHVSLGWCDVFAHFADPGHEHKETLATGAAAASKGGYTSVMLAPNTNPCIDNKTQIDAITARAQHLPVQLHCIGAISNGAQGKNLAEMYDMHNAGAVAFSDGLNCVNNNALLLKAMQYVNAINATIIQQPIEHSLTQHALMHEGDISTQLGIPGMMREAEHMAIQRDLALLEYSNSKLHITGISCAGSIALIRDAKKKGLRVTCSTTPYHLLYTHDALVGYDSHYKVNPPLRTKQDRAALIKGINDGTIDCIATHHNPQDWDAKQCEFAYAAPGMIGLQSTLFAILAQHTQLDLARCIDALTIKPRQIFGLPMPTFAEGEKANLTVWSNKEQTEYNAASNASKSANSPMLNHTWQGKILATINHHHCTLA